MEELAPFAVGALIFMTPIVAILAKHQQKMAEILHGGVSRPGNDVQNELAALREMVVSQAVSIDALATSQRELVKSLGEGKHLEQRLNHP